MADFLESLGQGLRGAGAILSSPVYEQQNREQDIMLREMAVRREQLGRALLLGIQQGSVDPNNDQVKMTLQRLGVPANAFGPSPQARSAAEGLRADSALRARLPKAGMPASSDELLKTLTSGGLEDLTGPMGEKLLGIASTMQNREAQQELRKQEAAANNQLLSSMKGDALPDSRADIVGFARTKEEAQQLVAQAAAQGKKATYKVGGENMGLFGSLINSPYPQIAQEARTWQRQLNAAPANEQTVKFFLTQQAKLAQQEAAFANRPPQPLVQIMTPDGPRWSTRGDAEGAAPPPRNPLGTTDPAALAKQGTEDPLEVMKKYGFSGDGAELAAYNKMFNNKYPPGLAQQARNAAIDNYAAKLARDAGLDMAALATLPAQKKADAQALMKRTQIIASMEGTFSSFENNMDTWEQIAAGVAPKLAGKLDKSVIDSFSKINFTDSMTANDIKNAIAKQFNDPSTVAYLTATMTVAMDYARIISSQGGVSGARVTDTARKEAMQMIPAGINDQARKSLRATLTADANGQLQGQVKAAERLRKNLGVVNPANAQQPGVTEPATTTKPASSSAAGDWLDRAMKANPSMTREQVIAEGKKRGKLPEDFK